MEPKASRPPEASAAGRLRLFRPFEILMCCELAVLVLAATAHRFQIDSPEAYRNSPLVLIEVVGLVVAFGIVPFAFLRSLFFAYFGRSTDAGLNLLISLLAFFAALTSGWIDSPTLIYAA